MKKVTLRKLLSLVPGVRPLYKKMRNLILEKPTYDADGLITKKNCDFMKDPKFIEAYTKGKRQWDITYSLYWTFHVTQFAAFHGKQLQGDFVECGTYRGMHAMSTMTYIDFHELKDRKYYLFDTFSGLDKEYSSEKECLAYKAAYPDCYSFVVNSFKELLIPILNEPLFPDYFDRNFSGPEWVTW